MVNFKNKYWFWKHINVFQKSLEPLCTPPLCLFFTQEHFMYVLTEYCEIRNLVSQNSLTDDRTLD